MLTFKNISIQRGGHFLIEAGNLRVNPGDRVGVVGKNGCGKSSLLATLTGGLQLETGEIEIGSGLSIAHVDQDIPQQKRSLIDFVMDGDMQLRQIELELAQAEDNHDGIKIAELHQQLDAIEGYRAKARAARILSGLGFEAKDHSQDLGTFSGGWQMRLKLARALMCRSDILLLDEPTNHLDLDAVIWLEQWLAMYQGVLLLISHDREFLDGVVTRIAFIESRLINVYTGNYSQFEALRASQLELQSAQFKKQQKQIAKLESFVQRFKAKATKAKQAQSRVKALERMQTVAAVQSDSPFRFSFIAPGRMPNPLIELTDVSAGYSQNPVFNNVNLNLSPGDRVALLGANGAGKSTLIKLLAGELKHKSGVIRFARDCRVGYFAQHQVDQLDANASALEIFNRLSPDLPESQLRKHLGGFGFSDDDVFRPCGGFSGGEKSRLMLAMVVWQKPNLLLLDEPTNHLDIKMREALTLALQDFQGAILLVSHDRNLLRTTADRLLLVANESLADFDGDMEDYRSWLINPAGTSALGSDSSDSNRKLIRQQAAERRQQIAKVAKPIKTKLAKIDQELIACGKQKEDLDAILSDPAMYTGSDGENLQSQLKRQAELNRDIELLESQWIELAEQLEAIESEF